MRSQKTQGNQHDLVIGNLILNDIKKFILYKRNNSNRTIIDFPRRNKYFVDLENFQINSSINIDEVVNNVTLGDGYAILKGLFDQEDINHAKETILYLISRQGAKATHFQVLTPDSCWIYDKTVMYIYIYT